jgi:inner membrane protein
VLGGLSGSLPDLGRVLFVGGALLTHAGVGYALVRALTDADPRLGLLFGVALDGDFLFPASLGFPFVHRGIVHTPVFLLFAVALVYLLSRREVAIAASAALASHLLIDGLSPAGIMWLYPVTAAPSPGLPVHGPVGTVILWGLVGGILSYDAGGRVRVAVRQAVHRLRGTGGGPP